MKIIMHGVKSQSDAAQCHRCIQRAIERKLKTNEWMPFTIGEMYITVTRNKNSYTARFFKTEE